LADRLVRTATLNLQHWYHSPPNIQAERSLSQEPASPCRHSLVLGALDTEHLLALAPDTSGLNKLLGSELGLLVVVDNLAVKFGLCAAVWHVQRRLLPASLQLLGRSGQQLGACVTLFDKHGAALPVGGTASIASGGAGTWDLLGTSSQLHKKTVIGLGCQMYQLRLAKGTRYILFLLQALCPAYTDQVAHLFPRARSTVETQLSARITSRPEARGSGVEAVFSFLGSGVTGLNVFT